MKSIAPQKQETSFAGTSVIGTGGDSGHGWGFARQCLILNTMRVIISTRPEDEGVAAIVALRADTTVQINSPIGELDFSDLVLDDYQSGLRFIQRVSEEVSELPMLLCNGGTNSFLYKFSKRGHGRIMRATGSIALFLTGLNGKNHIESFWNDILEDIIKANLELQDISYHKST
ncbi:carbonyl reductase [Penicillium pulvis]|uniref:carbonyl reductase n=1 Tax=Penicillium pulvis TaxID=1562058 RepID=UPI0025481F27|nr:carbonyl reductase [Penicillium pulvis]KAJ5784782.1 carbonyl reductase [Penicillium pulvis]